MEDRAVRIRSRPYCCCQRQVKSTTLVLKVCGGIFRLLCNLYSLCCCCMYLICHPFSVLRSPSLIQFIPSVFSAVANRVRCRWVLHMYRLRALESKLVGAFAVTRYHTAGLYAVRVPCAHTAVPYLVCTKQIPEENAQFTAVYSSSSS